MLDKVRDFFSARSKAAKTAQRRFNILREGRPRESGSPCESVAKESDDLNSYRRRGHRTGDRHDLHRKRRPFCNAHRRGVCFFIFEFSLSCWIHYFSVGEQLSTGEVFTSRYIFRLVNDGQLSTSSFSQNVQDFESFTARREVSFQAFQICNLFA